MTSEGTTPTRGLLAIPTLKLPQSGYGSCRLPVPGIRKTPPLLWVFVLIMSLLRNMDLTIVIPSSEEMVDSKELDLAFSGLVIGSFGIGSIIGPCIYWSLTSFRSCFIMFAVLMLAGNLLYVLALCHLDQYWYPALNDELFLIVARIVKGLSAGGTFSMQLLIIYTTSTCVRSRYIGWRETAGMFGNALGLVLGGGAMIVFPGQVGYLLPIVLMVVVSIVLLVCIIMFFPSEAELVSDPNYFELNAHMLTPRANPQDHDDMPLLELNKGTTRAKYAFLLLCTGVGFTRLFLRVGIEAGAVTVLEYDHGVSPGKGGLIVAIFVFVGVGTTYFQAQYMSGFDEQRQLMGQQVVCLAACAALAIPGSVWGTASMALAVFIFYGCILYSVNVISAAVSISLVSKITPEPGNAFLDKRNVMLILMVSKDGFGVLCGPWAVRWLIQVWGDGQLTLASVCAAMVLSQVILLLVCMRWTAGQFELALDVQTPKPGGNRRPFEPGDSGSSAEASDRRRLSGIE